MTLKCSIKKISNLIKKKEKITKSPYSELHV